MVLTAGMALGTLTEALSYSTPQLLGNAYDTRTFRGFDRYNPALLPGAACADGSAEALFADGVVGCDGAWGASSASASAGGLAAAGRALCSPGFELCASADAVAALGVKAGGCAAAGKGTFYVTGASSQDGLSCGAVGVGVSGGSGGGVEAWGCGNDGDDCSVAGSVAWGQSDSCGVLSGSIFACGNLSESGHSVLGAWNRTGASAQTIVKGVGNGGVMCCRTAVALPLGALNQGINCDDAAAGTPAPRPPTLTGGPNVRFCI